MDVSNHRGQFDAAFDGTNGSFGDAPCEGAVSPRWRAYAWLAIGALNTLIWAGAIATIRLL